MAKKDLSFYGSPMRQRTCVPVVLSLSIAFICATAVHGQDVADAARQQQAKKDSRQKNSKHVYTAEDLKQATILTPEDREKMDARKKQNAAPGEQPAEAIDAQAAPVETAPAAVLAEQPASGVVLPAEIAPVEMPTIPAELSLGDVARAYLQQKQLQHFFDSQQWAQFHLPVSNAPLAAPKPPVLGGLRAPANPVVIVLPAVRPPMDPTTTIHPTRRSPFARPVMGPAIRPRLVAPPVVKSEPAEIAKPAPEPIAKLNPTAAAKLAPAPFAVASVVPKSVAPVEPRVAVPAGSSVRLVIVQRGDSLWKLAQQNLGGGLRWHELLAANPSVVDPQRLGVGTKLVVPAATVSMPTSSRIIVRKGDTLWALAQTHLGRATSWTCIAQANPMVPDPQRIFVGQELLLPASCTP